MKAKSVFMMGVVVILATTGLFVALTGFAADGQTARTSEERMATVMAGGVKVPATPASQWQVVDAEGNAYLLTPVKAIEGKASVECVHSYTMPTSH